MFAELVQRVHDHYLAHFRAFVALHRGRQKRGAAEVKFRMPVGGENACFGGIYCVDYVENDVGGVIALSLEPDKKLDFKAFLESHGPAMLDVRGLCWDDVRIAFDGDHASYANWFEKWFDPNDAQYDAQAEFTGKIHSLSPGEKDVAVDFGTAPPLALFELIDVIIAAGSTRLTLSTAR